jgi:hypothetical protein
MGQRMKTTTGRIDRRKWLIALTVGALSISSLVVAFIVARDVADKKLWLHDASPDGRFNILFSFPGRQYSAGDAVSFGITCGRESKVIEDRLEVWLMAGTSLGPGIAFWASGYVSTWMPGMTIGLSVGKYAVGVEVTVTIKIIANDSFMVCIGGTWTDEYPCWTMGTEVTGLRLSGDGFSGQNIDFYIDDIDLSWTPDVDETFDALPFGEDVLTAATTWASYPDDIADGNTILHEVSNLSGVYLFTWLPVSVFFAFTAFLAAFGGRLFTALRRGGYMRLLNIVIRGRHVHHWIFAAASIVVYLFVMIQFCAFPRVAIDIAGPLGFLCGLFLEGIAYPDAFTFKARSPGGGDEHQQPGKEC